MTRRARELAAENRRLGVVLGVALFLFGVLVSVTGCRRPASGSLEAPAPAVPAATEAPAAGDFCCTGPDCLPPAPR